MVFPAALGLFVLVTSAGETMDNFPPILNQLEDNPALDHVPPLIALEKKTCEIYSARNVGSLSFSRLQ